jgi:hypothetical protein
MHVVTDIARRVGWRRRALNAGGIQLAYTGGVAQLGERLLCKQEVIGSIPFTSTIILVLKRRKARATRRGDPLGSRA